MANYGSLEVVQGAWNTKQIVLFPSAGEMFTDATRKKIVSDSLEAHALFVKATALDASDPHRASLLKLAMQMRVDEKARWLALTPPDLDGGWKADLAIASYLWEACDMVAAFDTLARIRAESPVGSSVHRMAAQNLHSMYKQVRPQLPAHETQHGSVSAEVLVLVRRFWEWVASLPDGDDKHARGT